MHASQVIYLLLPYTIVIQCVLDKKNKSEKVWSGVSGGVKALDAGALLVPPITPWSRS